MILNTAQEQEYSVEFRENKKANEFEYRFIFQKPATEADIPGGGSFIASPSRDEYFRTYAEVIDGHYALFWGYRVKDGGPNDCMDGREFDTTHNFFGINNLDQVGDVKFKLKRKLIEIVKDHSSIKPNISKRLSNLPETQSK